MVPFEIRDKLYAVLFVVAMIAGSALSLSSPGYLLGFNSTTLMLMAMCFTAMSANLINEKNAEDTGRQIMYTGLVVVPIGLRWALNMPWFGVWEASTVTVWQQLVYMAQVVGIWVLVAVSEEAFRGAMMNSTELFIYHPDPRRMELYQIVFANTVWVLFHFIQRPLEVNLYRRYIVWLYASGLVMTYALKYAGMGAATLIHVLVNLTA
jgi:hypothetical protein